MYNFANNNRIIIIWFCNSEMTEVFFGEYRRTWKNPDVKAWKSRARKHLKYSYLANNGTQWHEYPIEETSLLTIKICYALHGKPTYVENNNGTLENAYKASQKATANKIKNKIIEIFKDFKVPKLQVGIIFIACKRQKSEFLMPIFRVYIGNNNGDVSKYVDTDCRTYKNWTDWKKNNKLPMLKYCYPSRGFFTCSGNYSYQFDPERDPDVNYGTSPACDFLARVVRQGDKLSDVTSLTSGGVAMYSMFTPEAPIVLTAATTVGTAASFYKTGRCACLKVKHFYKL